MAFIKDTLSWHRAVGACGVWPCGRALCGHRRRGIVHKIIRRETVLHGLAALSVDFYSDLEGDLLQVLTRFGPVHFPLGGMGCVCGPQ